MLRTYTLILLAFLAIVPQTLQAQMLNSPELMMETNRVSDVILIGYNNLDPSLIQSRILVKKGEEYAPALLQKKVRESVESLFNWGMLADVRVEADYLKNSTDVKLIFYVTELPALDTLVIEGNDELLLEDLDFLVRLNTGQLYSPSDIERDRQALLRKYREEGFLLAEIEVLEELNEKSGRYRVEYRIHEGEKVMVKEIIIEGNEAVTDDEYVSGMGSEIDRWYSSGEFRQEQFEADADSVVNVARHHGFLDAEILEKEADYIPDPSFRFYLGRLNKPGTKLPQILEVINRDASQADSPLGKVIGPARASRNPYFLRHRSRFSEKAQATPVPSYRNEKELVDDLNRLIALRDLREKYIAAFAADRQWDNPKADSLYQKRASLPDSLQKFLVRLMLEDQYPVARYAETNTSSAVRLRYTVREGQKYYAGNFAFSGNEVLSTPLLNSRVTLDSGDVFDYREYEMMRMGLMNLYREDGYLFVNLNETKSYFQDSVLSISFDITEGLPAQVHKVRIRGNTKTKDKVIRREVKLFPGDTYRQSLMERSFRDIMQLNYFDNVLPDIQVVGEQDVDLVFDVSEREAGTGTFSAGVAYSQSDGMVGTLGLQIPNCCMGDGQKAELNIEYGPDKRNYTVGFSEPWFLDQPTRIGGSVNYTWYRGAFDDNDITRYGWSAYAGRRLKWPDDYFYAQLSYYWQMNEQGDNVDNSMILYSGLESSVGVTITRDDKNLPIFPTDGSRYSLSVRRAGVGGDFDYWKTNISIKWWFPLIGDLALGLENEMGFLTGDAIQYSSLFRMGGMLGYQGKLRGYSPGTIGYRRLGRSYQSLVAQLQYPVAENVFYLLAFFDAGNVYGEPFNPSTFVAKDQASPLTEWDPTDLRKDYGMGFRVMVPMLGIIGFDFGWPLDPGENYDGTERETIGDMQLNFVISQGF